MKPVELMKKVLANLPLALSERSYIKFNASNERKFSEVKAEEFALECPKCQSTYAEKPLFEFCQQINFYIHQVAKFEEAIRLNPFNSPSSSNVSKKFSVKLACPLCGESEQIISVFIDNLDRINFLQKFEPSLFELISENPKQTLLNQIRKTCNDYREVLQKHRVFFEEFANNLKMSISDTLSFCEVNDCLKLRNKNEPLMWESLETENVKISFDCSRFSKPEWHNQNFTIESMFSLSELKRLKENANEIPNLLKKLVD